MSSEARKLPVMKIAGDAYLSVFLQLSTFVRVATMPFILAFFAGIAVGFIAGITGNSAQMAEPYSLFNVVGWFLQGTILALFAVAWHRVVLLGGDEARTRIGIDITRRELRFCAYAWVIALLIWVPYMSAHSGFAGDMIYGNQYKFSVPIIALLFWPMYVIFLVVRLNLVLPATAIERPITLQQSWKMTNGMTWRLVAIVLLCGLPLVLLRRLVASIIPELARTVLVQSVTELLIMVISFLQVGIAAAAVSYSYRWVIRSQQRGTDNIDI